MKIALDAAGNDEQAPGSGSDDLAADGPAGGPAGALTGADQRRSTAR
jgi:hypothetical protein